ncbi:MAG: glycosyltransferase [Synergistaceae bacterium]|nr:glycosyltransferase [Synergistaceae bacterium]
MNKISVVMPVYNTENYLSKCLEHIIRQTYANLEIVVVDDGSTDNSAAIAREYGEADPRIKLIAQSNGGLSSARNRGLEAASGDYVHFMDSDDFIELDYYEKMLSVAVQTHADIVCSEVAQPGVSFPRFDYTEILTSLEDKILKLQAQCFNGVIRYLFGKAFLDEHCMRFPDGVISGQDLIFERTALYYAHRVATVPNATYHVVDNPTSMGKYVDKLIAQKGNGAEAWAAFDAFKKEHGLDKILAKEAAPIKTVRLEFCHLPILTQKIWRYKTKYYILGIPFFRKITM